MLVHPDFRAHSGVPGADSSAGDAASSEAEHELWERNASSTSLAAVAGRALIEASQITSPSPARQIHVRHSPRRPDAASSHAGRAQGSGSLGCASPPASPSVSSMPSTPSGSIRPTGAGDHAGGPSIGPSMVIKDLYASTGAESKVTGAAPPTWCDRKPVAESGVSSTTTSGSAGGVVRRISVPSSVGSASGVRSSRDGPGAASATSRGDVSVCVRLRPGAHPQDERCVEPCRDAPGAVRLRQTGGRYDLLGEAQYHFDQVFHEDTPQDEVFIEAVAPICEAVIGGYNGAVIAYGQTGSGKTHTVVGNSRFRGIAPRAIHRIFEALSKRPLWSVEVSVLEIYNERVRDLLNPGNGSHVEVHEVKSDHEGTSFRCPDATRRQAYSPEEALAALTEGMKRRETARTDMNHNSSRSHLIFTLASTQRDPELGATLRGRLHLVDLAGSERLKRSMSTDFHSPRGSGVGARGSRPSLHTRTPRDQRREAGEINKSLSQLALVIQRLTNQTTSAVQLVPYRDSMLTRLLAESFGGSSKTCLIITTSVQAADREETRCSLEFGKRAKLVRNRAEINLEVAHQPSAVMEAMLAKKMEEMQHTQEELMRERDILLAERAESEGRLQAAEAKVKEAVADILSQQNARLSEVAQLEEQKQESLRRWLGAVSQSVELQEAAAAEVRQLQRERELLYQQLTEATAAREGLRRDLEVEVQRREELEESTRAQLAERQQHLDDMAKQAGQLRADIMELGREKAKAVSQKEEECAAMRAKWLEEVSRLEGEKAALTAEFEAERAKAVSQKEEECAAMRAKWLEEVSRLEGEKAALTAEFEAERAKLREQLEISRKQERAGAAVAASYSDMPFSVREATSRAEVAQQDGTELAARMASRCAALRQDLQAATEDTQRLDKMGQARILCLEAEATDMRTKWRQPIVEDKESMPPSPAVFLDDEVGLLAEVFEEGESQAEESTALPFFPPGVPALPQGEAKVASNTSLLGSPASSESQELAPSSPPSTKLMAAAGTCLPSGLGQNPAEFQAWNPPWVPAITSVSQHD